MELSNFPEHPSKSTPADFEAGKQTSGNRRGYWILVLIFLGLGIFLRAHLWRDPGYALGFDEEVYQRYVMALRDQGLAAGPAITQAYIADVQQAEFVFLPPTRLGYIVPAYLLDRIFSLGSYPALRATSVLGSCLYLAAGFVFVRRWLTPRRALAVLAILACAPLQIHITQYAFVDGVTAFGALVAIGCLRESLRQPRHLGWMGALALSTALLFLTKQETAVFVSGFMILALGAARPLGSCAHPLRPLAALASGMLLAGLLLIAFAGGLAPLGEALRLYMVRAQTLPYSMMTGDGPWHRYLIEHLLVNPMVFLLAVGAALGWRHLDSPGRFLLTFVVITYAIMASIPFSMNIRQTIMWDLPLAVLAVHAIAFLTENARRATLWRCLILGVVCLSALRQYELIFPKIYDTDPRFMLRAVKILK